MQCTVCGAYFLPNGANAKYCSDCRAVVRRAQCLAAAKRWQAAHPDKVRAKKRKWYAENPEKVRAKKRKWYAENPEKVRQRYLRRKAKMFREIFGNG